ncbi:helix-turn-helix domain-containing protein [Tissierella carlieri]|uniref:helix-turn-helix domain-containing protein n=1 Tax=Tissierella carlieri TaxID=689904 RepID=UPI0028058C99|nr:helix-turn-helix domain-containing protein [uncultured Tissierella sp.]
MEIGKKLKAARSKAGLTQETVANEIHVSRQTISNWENEKSYPDIVSVIILNDLYKVSLDELLKGDAGMIKHLEDSTNVVKSNKNLTIGTILWIIFYAGLLIVDTFFYKIPRIGGLWLNIFVMFLFFIGILWYFFGYIKVLKYIDREKKKKNLCLTLFIILYIGSIFLSFHLIGLIINKLWLEMALRGILVLALCALANWGYRLTIKRFN